MNYNSYLRDSWNLIDFVIVCTGTVELFTQSVNLKSLRTIRVLRPLKTISTMPSMRKLVKTLIYSLPELLNVLVFLIFIFAVFSIMGLQTYQGVFYNFCRQTEKPLNATFWPKVEDIENRLCSPKNEGVFKCPENTFCGSPFDFGMELEEMSRDPVI